MVHEYGHFQVARWCGVKVLRFSFGFGKVLCRWHDKKGTEYVWSLFPLGGYVKMLDESEGEVLPEERHLAFNNKSVLARIAIVLAGPALNFLFAFVALWLVLVIGVRSLAPIIGTVEPNSLAAQAGVSAQQEIISFNNQPIDSWRDFHYAMMPLIGSDKTVDLTVKSVRDGQEHHFSLPLAHWHFDEKNPNPINSLGLEPFIPTIPAIVGEVVADSPAAQAGLAINDKITSLNGTPFTDWLFLVEYVRQHPSQEITLSVERLEQQRQLKLVIGTQNKNGVTEGFIGVRSQKINWPANWLRTQRQSPLRALFTAGKQTIELTKTTFTLMGRLATGKLSLNTISGPVGIAQGAGDSGRSGIVAYLLFLALVSISLGTLNLLPIPMLDGGHLLYYIIELVRQKPLSEAAKSIGLYVGLTCIVALMIIALTNDISRLIS